MVVGKDVEYYMEFFEIGGEEEEGVNAKDKVKLFDNHWVHDGLLVLGCNYRDVMQLLSLCAIGDVVELWKVGQGVVHVVNAHFESV